MIVMDNEVSNSPTPSILDSPTLARVERARIRNESTSTYNSPLNHTMSSYCPSVLSMGVGREMHAIKKGLLWQQRERLFSRWKERYFILTRDYLHCFKRSSGPDKISDMGQFIFKIKLVDVESVEWVNRKTYSVIALVLANRESKILLRAAQGLEDWFELLEECTMTSKERRKALRLYGNAFYSKDHSSTLGDSDHLTSINSHVDDWLLSRHPASLDPSLSDSVPDLTKYRPATRPTHKEHALWSTKHNPSPFHNRLSLLTDIDINYSDSNGSLKKSPHHPPYQNSVPPSPSHHVNGNVFFMPASGDVRFQSSGPPSSFGHNRPVLTPVGSFRNSPLFSPSRLHQERFATTQSQVKYRDRSQSDALNWKSRTAELNKNRRSVILQATHV